VRQWTLSLLLLLQVLLGLLRRWLPRLDLDLQLSQ
jgi:hypothetical protein